MRMLKINNFLMLGASGVSLLLAAVLLGTGQLLFSGICFGACLLLLLLGRSPRRSSQVNVKPGSP